MTSAIKTDADWIRQSFMLPKKAISNADAMRRTLTDARFKYTDTTLGGNFAINPPPQFTRFADLPVKSMYSNSKGMGRYYSEALDDNCQLIHMRFGVPKFNSLTNFFFNFYNPEAARLARTGRSSPLSFAAGKALGSIVTTPVQLLILAGSAIDYLQGRPTSKYYYLKPAMPLYWNAVNTIANGIAVNMGIIPRVFESEEKRFMQGTPENTAEISSRYQKLNPDIWNESGQLDVYSLASKAQRMANTQRDQLSKILETGESVESVRAALLEMTKSPNQKPKRAFGSYADYLSSWTALNDHSSGNDEGKVEMTGDTNNFTDKVKKFFRAEYEDGTQFVTFNVEHTGTASESFSNSAGESELSGKLNGLSSAGRQARFSTADMQSGIGFIDGAADMLGSFVNGAMESVKLSGLMAFSGQAMADIPKMWESSSASLPRSSYTIKLRTPYGNKFSRFCDLFIPLSMLLAGALPLAAGKQSYTSPFLCEIYDKGRTQTRLGMIESLSIDRGQGNLGWTRDGEPLGIDVTFTVADMSSVMYMPISAGFNGGDAAQIVAGVAVLASGASAITKVAVGGGLVAGTDWAKGFFSEDTAFSDYLAVLSSLTLTEQVYTYQKLRINMTKQFTSMNTWFSVSHFSNWVMGWAPARMITAKSVGLAQ